jgi:excisionase family DNA binding protein
MNSDLEAPRHLTELLTVSQIAHLLRVSKMTVYRLIQTGQLTATTEGRSFHVRRIDVTALLNDPRGSPPGKIDDPSPIAIPEQTRFPTNTTTTTTTAAPPHRHPATTGLIENGQLGVLLTHASTTGRAILDREGYPPTSGSEDPTRRREPGSRQWVELATKPELARRMLTRLLDSGAQIGWLSADEPYGDHPGLRTWCERIGLNYVMAIPGDHRIHTAHGPVRATELARAAGPNCWQRFPTGTTPTRHPPDDWLLIDPNPHPDSAARGHLVLVRRSITKPNQLTYHLCHSTQPVSLAELVAVAGARHHPRPG